MSTDPSPGSEGKPGSTPPRDESGEKYQGNRKGRAFIKPVIPHVKFEGKCAGLKGFIYDCSDNKQADAYVKTTREIAEYVGSAYAQGADVTRSIHALEALVFDDPPDPIEGATRTDIRKWEKRVDELIKRESKLEENLRSLYSLVWGQCTDPLRAKIRSLEEYAAMEEESDSLALIKSIRNAMYSYQSVTYRCVSIHHALKRFWQLHQGKMHSCQQYLEELENCVAVIDHCGGLIGVFPGIVDYLYELRGINDPSAIEAAQASKEAQEMFLATYFFLNADRVRFGKLIEDTHNLYLQGTDAYPKTITAAYSLLTNYYRDPRNMTMAIGTTSDGVAFAHSGNDEVEVALATDGKVGGKKDKSKVQCRKCKAMGHYANEEVCPQYKPKEGAESGTQLLMAGVDVDAFDDDDTVSFEFLQSGVVCKTDDEVQVPRTWILLDNQSTIDFFLQRVSPPQHSHQQQANGHTL